VIDATNKGFTGRGLKRMRTYTRRSPKMKKKKKK
jgi:hypothetical protein